jgi:hypothetical protein
MSLKCSPIFDYHKCDSGGVTVKSDAEFSTARVWDKVLTSLVSLVECCVIHA